MARLLARERITRVAEKWFVAEPLFFAVWTMHQLVVDPRIRSIRVGHGRIEVSPRFVDRLDARGLETVMAFEAMRIVLKHPYARRKTRADLAYLASNVTLQEYLDTELPVPRARDVFGDGHDLQYFELYYAKLLETPAAALTGWGVAAAGDGDAGDGDGDAGPLAAYAHPASAGEENTELWGADDLVALAVDEKILAAAETDSWGTLAGRHRERILATLRPKLDYRAVLRQFRASVLSIHRRLTRMKPNRRYGFLYMGSRYDFTTRLLVAVDVSGSMGSDDVARGFSVVNRFFKYGVRSIDVIQFDAEVKGPALTFRRARRSIVVEGRGGTSFEPLVDYVDEHPEYDGLIVFTDGYAPVPRPPRNRHTRLLWLFTHEHTYEAMREGLRRIGRAAFLREG
jgi:predicted metal-dependent peptidase